MEKKVKISFVIPTYGRFNSFVKLINSIEKSNIDKDDFEIIVVSSDPENSEKVKWINNKTDIDIRLFLEADRKSVRNRSLYYYENVGIKNSKYEWVLVANDDMWVEPDWYEKFLVYINDKNKVYLISSHIGGVNLGLRIPTIGTITIDGNTEPMWLYDMTIIHKSIYEKIGFLDEGVNWYGKGADISLAVAFLTDEKPIPCYEVKINHDLAAEHRGENIGTSINGGDFVYIKNKWNSWIRNNNKNYSYNWV